MIRLALAVMLAATSHVAVSVAELDTDPETWNGRSVVVTGEIVGDYSIRSDVVWVQLNDDDYVETPLAERQAPSGTNSGMGVRLPLDVFDDSWGPAGGYGVRGPIVEVEAVFRHNSPDDQGETFLDASSVELVEPSRPIEQRPGSVLRASIGVLLTLSGAALWWFGRDRHPARRS